MRDYARIKPQFWTRGDGKALRGNDAARVLVTYLFSCPNSNMVALYYLPLATMLAELGWSAEKLRATMSDPVVAKLVQYDEDEELVFIPTGARHQIGATIKPGDNLRKKVVKEVLPYAHHRFAREWIGIYQEPFNLRTGTKEGQEDLILGTALEPITKPLASPSEGVHRGVPEPLAKGSCPGPGLALKNKEEQPAPPRPPLPHAEDAGGSPQILALAECIETQPKLHALRPSVHVAQEILGALRHTANLTPGAIRSAVAEAVADLESHPPEASARRMLRWKLGDYASGKRRQEAPRTSKPKPIVVPETPKIVPANPTPEDRAILTGTIL